MYSDHHSHSKCIHVRDTCGTIISLGHVHGQAFTERWYKL